jgi:phospholipid-binding lipoprotein MlaA
MSSRVLIAALLALTMAGCATVPAGPKDPRDPFERFNRSMFRFNDAIDRAALKPAARGYVRVVPRPVRTGINHFLTNLGYPRTIINDALQGKLGDSGRDTARLVVNTVLGLGFFDPASKMGLDLHNEDFGQTLGKWGIHSGPYLMLPLFGPSTVRDGLGRVPDDYTTPRHYIDDSTVRWSIAAVDVIDARAGLLDTESLLNGAFDRYRFIRNAWLQRRQFQVYDGDVPAEDLGADDATADPATVPVTEAPASP